MQRSCSHTAGLTVSPSSYLDKKEESKKSNYIIKIVRESRELGMGHPGEIRTLKMAWQGRTLLSWVLRKVRVDFRQKMGERNSGQGLRNTNTTTDNSLRCSGS